MEWPPVVDEGNNIDGVFGSPERMKFGGNAAPAVLTRLEAIEEMTIQTDQLNLLIKAAVSLQCKSISLPAGERTNFMDVFTKISETRI